MVHDIFILEIGKQRHKDKIESLQFYIEWNKLKKNHVIFLKAHGVAEPEAYQEQILFHFYNFLRHIVLSSFSINSVLHRFGILFQRIKISTTKRGFLPRETRLQVKELRLSTWCFKNWLWKGKICLSSPPLYQRLLFAIHLAACTFKGMLSLTIASCSFHWSIILKKIRHNIKNA